MYNTGVVVSMDRRTYAHTTMKTLDGMSSALDDSIKDENVIVSLYFKNLLCSRALSAPLANTIRSRREPTCAFNEATNPSLDAKLGRARRETRQKHRRLPFHDIFRIISV